MPLKDWFHGGKSTEELQKEVQDRLIAMQAEQNKLLSEEQKTLKQATETEAATTKATTYIIVAVVVLAVVAMVILITKNKKK